MNDQVTAGLPILHSVGGMGRTTVAKSRLREPEVLALAMHGVVEVRTGGDDDVAMLPWRQFHEMGKILELMKLFMRVVLAEPHHLPRALLGDAAFVADLTPDERQQFLEDFAEALNESERINDHRPASYVLDVYRKSSAAPPSRNPMFRGELPAEVGDALAAHVAAR
jgi:hypothetical protein